MMARHGWNRNPGEPVARPVVTSCSDLPQRSIWLDKSRLFVHTFCTNKLHLVATCHDGWYGRTTSGNLYTIWLRCVNILPVMSGQPDMGRQANTICLHAFWTLFRPRHVATTTSCRTYVVPQLVRPSRMAGIKSVVLCPTCHNTDVTNELYCM